jgi:hypothetical protein
MNNTGYETVIGKQEMGEGAEMRMQNYSWIFVQEAIWS